MDSKLALFELAIAVLESDRHSFHKIIEAAVQYRTKQVVGQLELLDSDAPVVQETAGDFFKRIVEGILVICFIC